VRDWGWEVMLRVRGFVRELLVSLNFSLDQRRGRERRGGLTREGEEVVFHELCSGEGRKVVAEADAGKEVPGAAFL
jgi:hypothetical protein